MIITIAPIRMIGMMYWYSQSVSRNQIIAYIEISFIRTTSRRYLNTEQDRLCGLFVFFLSAVPMILHRQFKKTACLCIQDGIRRSSVIE